MDTLSYGMKCMLSKDPRQFGIFECSRLQSVLRMLYVYFILYFYSTYVMYGVSVVLKTRVKGVN